MFFHLGRVATRFRRLIVGLWMVVVVVALLVPATMRLLGNLNWWLPFAGVQRHPPALAEYTGAGELEAYRLQATQDELLKGACKGGKQ
jgi:hypothetical protein